MKRHLKNNQYQLSDTEREGVWQGIRRDIKGAGDTGGPDHARTSFKPALGVAAAVALVVVMGSWWIGVGRLGQDDLISGTPDIALRQEAAPGARSIDMIESGAVMEKEMGPNGEITENLSEENAKPVMTLAARSKMARDGTRTLTGRLRDADTGEAIEHASILIRGSAHSAFTDSSGGFTFTGLEPGDEITLQVMMLGYAKGELDLLVPDEGKFDVALHLRPIVVAVLEEFDVEGAEYMVEVKSAVTEHSMSSETFQKYAIDSVDDARSKQSGVVSRAGESFVRGGRSGETSMKIDGVAQASMGSVTGGTKPPNGESIELMYFDHVGTNPFVATEDDSLSTFALDVDNASWTMARNYLERGMMPPKDAIRVEEFVNAFDAGWKSHTDDVFRIHTDGGLSRFGDGYHLLRIGVVGKTVDASERKPANLVFVIDISGSMSGENRLGAVKKALHVLLGELKEGDTVGIVVYGSQGEIRLEPTDISNRQKITKAIDALGTGGSTNVYEGLELAYRMARDNYEAGELNRLILCSDGVANNGASTQAEEILDLVRKASDESITISAIGFGMGNYNDVMMEKLANTGDGNYYYVDKHEEAERVFRENLTGLLQTIAREVKIQVDFDAESVDRWRLLGYENRDVADRDFRNDAVDAGEVGVGHQVTALYEVKLKPSPKSDRTVAVVRLRHEAPAHDTARAGQVEEIEMAVPIDSFVGDYGDSSPWRRAQMVAAEFAEILRHSYWAKESRLAALVPLADALVMELPTDAAVKDLADMIRKAADIDSGQEDDDE